MITISRKANFCTLLSMYLSDDFAVTFSVSLYLSLFMSLYLSVAPLLCFSLTISLSLSLSSHFQCKVYQTGELGCLDGSSGKMKELLALRSALYSTEFREFICSVTGCEELTDRVDCSANAYVTGTYMLMIIDRI